MSPPARRSALLGLYLGLSRIAAPAARLLLARRLTRGKEEAARLPERIGAASAPRPEGRLVWLHGASVGEGLAALALIERMARARPDLRFLLTTGTATSARLIGPRLPESATHQYAPLDALAFVERFLRHWRPDLCARVDSELWPATLWASARTGAPLALVNARVSAASARGWGRARGMAAALLSRFDAILAQDGESAERLAGLGAPRQRLRIGGSLKASVAPPEADPQALAALRAALGGRPVWLAASTHPGEEALAFAAHRAAREAAPGLALIVAPRHPERGAEIAALARAHGLEATRRSAGEGPEGAEVHVADTLGEMGLWYRLAPVAFMGGSTGSLGGHNPYEAAALGALILRGPDVAAFREAYGALSAAGASVEIGDAAALAAALGMALAPDGGLRAAAARMAEAGRAALRPDPGPLDGAAAALLGLLEARR
ncbi:MAG: 3-deoxy-D-manno-octulosonic acid transferase [Rubrimonas sp.]|uniref:3-deoxy-D-manno-octulosonic acid transferase n=1 Tax=Rubrimonas sp. TaxID=2036015 RepID=UPI002FDC7D4E